MNTDQKDGISSPKLSSPTSVSDASSISEIDRVKSQKPRKHTDVLNSASEYESNSPRTKRRGRPLKEPEYLDRSPFNSEADYLKYQEELDRKIALKIAQEYEMEEKLKLTAFRFKGSEGEYSLRKKSTSEVTSEPPSTRRSNSVS